MATLEQSNRVASADRWPVKPSRGGLIGIAAAAALGVLGVADLIWAVQQPIGPPVFAVALGAFLVAIGAAILVIALGYFRLSYQFAPGRLLIRWSGPTETVFLNDVDGIYAGQRVGQLRQVRGLSWPGYHVGLVRNRALGTLWAFCTDLEVDSLSVVVTPARTLVLTPVDPPAFRRELIRRIETNEAAGQPGDLAEQEAARLPDPLIVALIAAAFALLLAGIFGIAAAYERMPEMIALEASPVDRPRSLNPRSDIVGLPLLGACLLALNLLLALLLGRRERAASVLLCATATLIQAVIFVAILRLLT